MASLADEIKELIQGTKDVYDSSYISAAAITIMLWDWLLTMDDEVRLVWKKPHTYVTWIYYINRYSAFLFIIPAAPLARFHGPLSKPFCKTSIVTETVVTWITSMASMWLLFLRVIAVYNDNKSIQWSIYILYFTYHTAIGAALIVGLIRTTEGVYYETYIGLCVANRIRIINYLYSVILFMEIYVFLLLVYHQYRTRGEDGMGSFNDQTVLGTIRRNGYLYFLLAITVKMVDWLILLIGRPSIWWLFAIIDPVFNSVVTCRFNLQLRSVAEPKVHVMNTTELDTLTSTYPSTPLDSFSDRMTELVRFGRVHGSFNAFKQSVFSSRGNEAKNEKREEGFEDVDGEMVAQLSDEFVFDRADTRMDV